MQPYEQMCEELKLRNYADGTVNTYEGYVADFIAYFDQRPEELHKAHIREFLLDVKSRVGPSAQKVCLMAIKFFFRHGLERPEEVEDLRSPKIPKVSCTSARNSFCDLVRSRSKNDLSILIWR